MAGGKGDDRGYSSFLAGDDDAVVRVEETKLPGSDDFLLCQMVDFGDEIVLALGLDLEVLHPVQVAEDDVTGTAGGLDGQIEHRLHGILEAVLAKSGGRGALGRQVG